MLSRSVKIPTRQYAPRTYPCLSPNFRHRSDTFSGRGDTATVTVNPYGRQEPRQYVVAARVSLGTLKQEVREKARADGLDVFDVRSVNGRYVDNRDGGFYDSLSEDQGGERA